MEENLRDKVQRMASELVLETYRYTLEFPKFEQYALGNQIRRSLISVPANIVEGRARGSKRDLKRFLNISFASLAEFKCLWELAFQLGYLKDVDYQRVLGKSEELSRLLWSLITAVKKDI